MDDQQRQRGGDETWCRLRNWTKGQKVSERLAAALLQTEGYSGVDPSHPLGGKDGGKDGLCRKDGLKLVFAAYFPKGQRQFRYIKQKFIGDLKAVARNNANGMVFVTNQELTLGERKKLDTAAKKAVVEIYHLERLTSLLCTPKNYGIRFEYLEFRPTDAEYFAFLAVRDEEHYQRLQEVNGSLDKLVKRMEEQTADLIGYATGGDSIAYFSGASWPGSQVIRFHLLNDSKYPVFDVRGDYVDLDERIDSKEWRPYTRHSFAWPYLYSHQMTGTAVFSLDMGGRDRYRINIFIQTRTRSVCQEVRIFRGPEHFITAERIRCGETIVKVHIPPSVPGYNAADPEAVFQGPGSAI